MRRLDDKYGTRRMSNDGFGSGAEKDSPQASASVGGNNNQVDGPLLGHSDDFRSSFTVNNQFFNVQPGAFIAFSQLRQFAFG